MTKLDRLKEDIALEKQVFFVLFAAGLALLGWLFTNALKAEPVYTYVAIIATIADTLLVAFFLRRVKNNIRKLEDL